MYRPQGKLKQPVRNMCVCSDGPSVYIAVFTEFVLQKSTVTLKDVGGIDHCLPVKYMLLGKGLDIKIFLAKSLCVSLILTRFIVCILYTSILGIGN